MLDYAVVDRMQPQRMVRRLRRPAMQGEKYEGGNKLEVPEVVCSEIVAGLMHRAMLDFHSGNCDATRMQVMRVAATKGHKQWPRGDTALPNGVEGWRVPIRLTFRVVDGLVRRGT